VRSSSGATPDRPALLAASGALSYGDLEEAAGTLAERLRALGGGLEGQRVAVVAPNTPALPVAMLAAWRAGAACVPLSARLREYELRGTLGDAEPVALVAVRSHGGYSFRELAEELAPALPSLRGCLFVDEQGRPVEELAPDRAPTDAEPVEPGVAAVLYTSGSTGDPKGALVTHGCLTLEARELADRLRLEPADTTLLVIPASHAFGLACLLASFASGGTCALVDSSFSLDPLIEAARAHGATVLHGSPALFVGLLKASPSGLPGLRSGLVGGASCPPGLIERLDATGARILNVFGMTELGAATSCLLDDPPEVRYETAGRPLPGYELRAVPAAGAEPEIGEIEVRGPSVTPGYFRRPDLTAEAFDGDWFRTGDLGSIDGGGDLRIAGRAKELVQVGGFNVFPAEVETFLLTHADVQQATVVGVPDERMGEALAAFVVARPGSSLEPAELLRFARGRIAGYKLPYSIRIVDELPLLPSGKPDRVALRERLVGESAPARA
jgi:long-chain acyl-CoA synthetase